MLKADRLMTDPHNPVRYLVDLIYVYILFIERVRLLSAGNHQVFVYQIMVYFTIPVCYIIYMYNVRQQSA